MRSGTKPSVELADLSDFIVVARGSGGDFEPASRPCYAAGPMTIRGERRQGEVLVTVDGTPLDWRASLVVRNHSPTARVPRRLALAILLAVTDAVTAERFYQKFKRDVLSPIEADHWMLDAGDVRRWLELAAETDDVVRMAVNEA